MLLSTMPFIHCHYAHTSVSVCTLPNCQCGGVDQKQQDIVEKALEHWCASMEVVSQILAGQTDSTD